LTSAQIRFYNIAKKVASAL